MEWSKTQLVSIHRPGRVISIYKDREDGWCILLQVSSYLLHRYTHLPGRPMTKNRAFIREILCEGEDG